MEFQFQYGLIKASEFRAGISSKSPFQFQYGLIKAYIEFFRNPIYNRFNSNMV